ncbi:hypothetical protein OZ410_10110 [Robiginitalea sp. M366]|uniref:hypothetical protein n=1 Tax=Robiginitalea aestuariiviva TaxID=3036903 RepID=UPI00240E90D9|nr:hypothetical protein [Robiginitalea aestuariiviva]MDG1572668.1 hypothetical protein [Robiginitalea aestuariiviva]
MVNRTALLILMVLITFSSCKNRKQKSWEELEYDSVTLPEISIVIEGDFYHDFQHSPTIFKFSGDKLEMLIYRSEIDDYEKQTLKLIEESFLEDGYDYRRTIYRTDSEYYPILKLRESKENMNVHYLEGIPPNNTMTTIGISENTFEQIGILGYATMSEDSFDSLINEAMNKGQ